MLFRSKYESQGNTRKATEAREAIGARREWLTQAQNALNDFS